MASGEYINKDTLVKYIKNMKCYTKDGEKKGDWLYSTDSDGNIMRVGKEPIYACSACGFSGWVSTQGIRIPMIVKTQYCPSCGAKMGEVVEDD